MYIVIYSFEVRPNRNKVFLSIWKDLTVVIFQNCNSLGSRLHKESENNYIAYAQWPNKETFDNSDLPDEFDELKSQLKDTCKKIEVLHRLNTVEDLLQK